MYKTLIVLLFVCAATAEAGNWSSGPYVYDGAGNIIAIGADSYAYDTAGRLLRGTADQHRTGAVNRQEYRYDSFGNLVNIETFGDARCGANVNCHQNVEIEPTTNRIRSNQAAYDAAGNLTSIDVTYAYDYDPVGMMSKQIAQAVSTGYVYTANEERIAVYAYASGMWQWTLRDLAGAPLRALSSQDDPATGRASKNWSWTADYVHRGPQLLAANTPEGRRHLHLDHLGTPRLVTDDIGRQLSVHAYYAFGAELALNPPSQSTVLRLKFTGHERDLAADLHELDSMHARYYAWATGRFLSVDPTWESAFLQMPQSWNRYSYVMNNPLTYIDPTGLVFQCTTITLEDGSTKQVCSDVIVVEAERPKPDPQPTSQSALLRLLNNKREAARHTLENLKHFSLADAPIFREKKDIPCKTYWQRFLQAEMDTHMLPGWNAPTGISMRTAGQTAAAVDGITLMQWAKGGFGGSVLRGVSYTATETALVAGGTALANFALVTAAWEAGVAIGSAINAGLTDGCE